MGLLERAIKTGISKGKIYGFHGSFKEYNGKYSFSADVIYGDPIQMKPSKPVKLYLVINQQLASSVLVKNIKDRCFTHRGTAVLEFVLYDGVDEDGHLDGKPRKVIADSQFNVDATNELITLLRECDGVVDVYTE